MKRRHKLLLTCVLLTSGAFFSRTSVAEEAPKPEDRVVAMYFHRTQRCPTCQKMGTYTEEAIKAAFAEELEKGTVEFHYVDFQDAKNSRLAKAYKITGPALIVANVKGKKAQEYRNLKEIWTKVQEKPEFFQYVQTNLEEYLKKSASAR